MIDSCGLWVIFRATQKMRGNHHTQSFYKTLKKEKRFCLIFFTPKRLISLSTGTKTLEYFDKTHSVCFCCQKCCWVPPQCSTLLHSCRNQLTEKWITHLGSAQPPCGRGGTAVSQSAWSHSSLTFHTRSNSSSLQHRECHPSPLKPAFVFVQLELKATIKQIGI